MKRNSETNLTHHSPFASFPAFCSIILDLRYTNDHVPFEENEQKVGKEAKKKEEEW